MQRTSFDTLVSNSYNPNNGSFDSLVTKMQNEKISSIHESINEIERLIKERQQLSNELITAVDGISAMINNVLNRFTIQDNNQDKPERLRIMQKLTDVEQLKVAEKLNCWRDIALLKKEMREHLKETRDQQSNINILDSILK